MGISNILWNILKDFQSYTKQSKLGSGMVIDSFQWINLNKTWLAKIQQYLNISKRRTKNQIEWQQATNKMADNQDINQNGNRNFLRMTRNKGNNPSVGSGYGNI